MRSPERIQQRKKLQQYRLHHPGPKRRHKARHILPALGQPGQNGLPVECPCVLQPGPKPLPDCVQQRRRRGKHRFQLGPKRLPDAQHCLTQGVPHGLPGCGKRRKKAAEIRPEIRPDAAQAVQHGPPAIGPVPAVNAFGGAAGRGAVPAALPAVRFSFSGAAAFSTAGAGRRLISSNFARLRVVFTLCTAVACSAVRSSSTTLRACWPASPMLPSACVMPSSAARRLPAGSLRVESSSNRIVCVGFPPFLSGHCNRASSLCFSASCAGLAGPRSSTAARWVR